MLDMNNAPVYLFEASEKPSLDWFDVPLVEATPESVEDFGYLVDDPKKFEIEIVQWPQPDWRPVDAGTGDEAGYVEGIFRGEWKGDVLFGANEAVNGNYVLGWSADPQHASSEKQTQPQGSGPSLAHELSSRRGTIVLSALDKKPFVVPAALPGDDLKPEKVVAFWCDGSQGLYIHPGIWHEGIFPVEDKQRFLDRQGRVHARVSCDIGKEFGVYLSVPLIKEFRTSNGQAA